MNPLVLFYSFFLFTLSASSETTPFRVPSLPLAVRSPYSSAWMNRGDGKTFSNTWPTFWTGQIVGWLGIARVDGKAYRFLGAAGLDGVEEAHEKTVKVRNTPAASHRTN